MLNKTITALILSLSFMITQNSVCAEQTTRKQQLLIFSKASKHIPVYHAIKTDTTFDIKFRPSGCDSKSVFAIKHQAKSFNFKTRQDELRTVQSLIECTADQKRNLEKQLKEPGTTYIKAIVKEDWRCKEGLWFEVPSLRQLASDSSFSSDSSDF